MYHVTIHRGGEQATRRADGDNRATAAVHSERDDRDAGASAVHVTVAPEGPLATMRGMGRNRAAVYNRRCAARRARDHVTTRMAAGYSDGEIGACPLPHERAGRHPRRTARSRRQEWIVDCATG